MDMKVFGILGTKQNFVDKGQAALMTLFFFFGAVLKSILLLVFLPAVIFAATFFIREKVFSGSSEWWIFVLRMFSGGKVFYCRQHKDIVGEKK
jgi:hypothetical protein